MPVGMDTDMALDVGCFAAALWIIGLVFGVVAAPALVFTAPVLFLVALLVVGLGAADRLPRRSNSGEGTLN